MLNSPFLDLDNGGVEELGLDSMDETYDLVDEIYDLMDEIRNLMDTMYDLTDEIYVLMDEIYDLTDETYKPGAQLAVPGLGQRGRRGVGPRFDGRALPAAQGFTNPLSFFMSPPRNRYTFLRSSFS